MQPTRGIARELAAKTRRFGKNCRGAVAVEYGILLLMIVIALVGINTLSNVASLQNGIYAAIANAMRTS